MSGKKQTNSTHGFTLIEVLVVVSLTVIIMLTASALFMTFLISGAKTNNTQLVKIEGDQALNQMAFLLRNSLQLLPNSADPAEVCETGMREIALESYDGGSTTLSAQNDANDNNQTKIASSSGTKQQFLTSSAVQIIDGPTFDCAISPDGNPAYVQITFTLRKGTPNLDKARDVIEQTFTTGVSLRNFKL